jgi:hypothetical protein
VRVGASLPVLIRDLLNMKAVAALALALLLCLGRAASPAWYLIADDPKSNLNEGMPFTRRMDWNATSSKPTVVVAVPVNIPVSLQTCTDIAFDMPLYRSATSAFATPGVLTGYEWGSAGPTSIWQFASRQVTEMWSSSAGPSPNMTWQPDRTRGVYRYVHTFQTILAGGSTTWFGFQIDQTNSMPANGGNNVYFLGGPNASFAFQYVDVYGNWPLAGNGAAQLSFKPAPLATNLYTAFGTQLSAIALTIFVQCTPVIGGAAPPTSFAALPAPTWNAAGIVTPPPAPSPTPPTPPTSASSPSSTPASSPPNATSTSAPTTASAPPPSGSTVPTTPWVVITPITPVPLAPTPSVNDSAIVPSAPGTDWDTLGPGRTWLILFIVAVALGCIAALSIIIFIIVRRRRLAREQADVEKVGLKLDVDGTRAVEMEQMAPVIDPAKAAAHVGGTPPMPGWVEEDDEGEEEEGEDDEAAVELDVHEDDVVLHEARSPAARHKRIASGRMHAGDAIPPKT